MVLVYQFQEIDAVIRIHIDPKLREVTVLWRLALLAFLTYRLHPSCDYWRYAAIKRAELRSPSRPHRRLP